MEVEIEKANKEDLDAILKLQYLAYQSEAALLNNYDIPPLKQTRADLENEYQSGIILKAVNQGREIIGSVRGYEKEGTFYVNKLIVHPGYQGKGIGTRLLNEIEVIAGYKRYELFTSTQSLKNIRLYQRQGYRIYKEEKIDSLTFVYLEKNNKQL